MRRLHLPLILAAGLLAGGLAAGSTGLIAPAAALAEEEGTEVQVSMLDDRFNSSRLTVKAGTTVTWTHKGNNFHTVSALDGAWESGSMSRGDTFSFTFDEPGAYQYLCRQHLLQGMRGTITVE